MKVTTPKHLTIEQLLMQKAKLKRNKATIRQSTFKIDHDKLNELAPVV